MTGMKINGLEQLKGKLDRIEDFQRWANEPMVESIDALHERVQEYPPERPNSTYIRTRTLWASIKKEVKRAVNGIIGRVFSTGANQGWGDYEHYVKVEESQAQIHQGFWPTTNDDLAAEQENITAIFKREIDRLLNR